MLSWLMLIVVYESPSTSYGGYGEMQVLESAVALVALLIETRQLDMMQLPGVKQAWYLPTAVQIYILKTQPHHAPPRLIVLSLSLTS